MGDGDGATAAEDRRRVIEVALDRRPDTDVEGLRAVLRQVGMDVDTTTLVADLDALGYDAVDVADPPVSSSPDAFADATPNEGPQNAIDPRRAGVSFAAPSEPSDPQVGADDGDVDDRPPALGRPALLVGAVAVLIVLAALVFIAGNGDEVKGGGEDIATVPSTAGPTSTGSIPIAPVGPGADEELAAGVDGEAAFEAPTTEGLGQAPDGTEWDTVSGTWEASNGQGRLTAIEGADSTALALFDPELDSYRAQMDLPEQVFGHGLVFWADGPDNFWIFVASPLFATFVLVEVRDGERSESTFTENSGLTTAEDAAVIGVHIVGSKVEALVNGAVVLTHELDGDPPGMAMGLGAIDGQSGGAFDNFVYKADA